MDLLQIASDYSAFSRLTAPSTAAAAVRVARDDRPLVLLKRGSKDLLSNRSRVSIEQFRPSEGPSASYIAEDAACPVDASATLHSYSPSGRRLLTFRKDDKQRLLMELWSGSKLLHTIAVDAKLHGDTVCDGWFSGCGDGGATWTDDELYCAYVAEAPPIESAAMFELKTGPPIAGGMLAAGGGRTNVWSQDGGGCPPGAVRESWGERYDGVRCPRIFLVHVADGTVAPLAGIGNADPVSVGQPVWAPTRGPQCIGPARYVLAYTAWPHGDRRLGMIYCYNRPSYVSAVDMTPTLAAGSSRIECGEPPAHLCVSPATCTLNEQRGGGAARVDHSAVPTALVARSPRFLPALQPDISPTAAACVLRLSYLVVDGPALFTHGGSSQLAVAEIVCPPLPQSGAAASEAGGGLLRLLSRPRAVALTNAALCGTTGDGDNTASTDGYPPSVDGAVFVHMLPATPFLGATRRAAGGSPSSEQVDMLLTCSVRGRSVPAIVSLQRHGGLPSDGSAAAGSAAEWTGSVSRFPAAESDRRLRGSRAVLAVSDISANGKQTHAVVLSASSPCDPETVELWLRQPGVEGTEDWRQLRLDSPAAAAGGGGSFAPLSWLELHVDYADASHGTDGSGYLARHVHAYLLAPIQPPLSPAAEAAVAPLPLVVVPHGGPHSTFGSEYLAPYAFLAACPRLALPCLFVNYTGSVGWSDAATSALAGRIGELDVREVHTATLAALAAAGDEGAYGELCAQAAAGGPMQRLQVRVRHPDGSAATFDIPGGGPATPPLLGHLSATHGLVFRRSRGGSAGDTAGNVSSAGGGVAVCGGSHGGFLAAHAVAQHPRTFSAAALRNPVINIATMAGSTDIPDWALVEVCGVAEARARLDGAAAAAAAATALTGDAPPAPAPGAPLSGATAAAAFAAYCRAYQRALSLSGELVGRMFAASPIARVAAVSAPCLTVLGMKDRRVPPSQGLEWHHALTSRGVLSQVLAFPEDGHPVDKPVSEAEAWVHIAAWLKQHTARLL